jgi:hypothetical protein
MVKAYQSHTEPLTEREHGRGSVVSFVSWEQLENVLRRAGQVRPGESVERFVVSARGVSLYVERH